MGFEGRLGEGLGTFCPWEEAMLGVVVWLELFNVVWWLTDVLLKSMQIYYSKVRNYLIKDRMVEFFLRSKR